MTAITSPTSNHRGTDPGSLPTASTQAPGRNASMNRVLAVTRLHFVNTWTVFVVPLMIMGFIFLVNFFIWWIIVTAVDSPADRADAQQGFSYSGASFYIFIYMMVVAIQAVNLTFPFALGYGVTRRHFAFGSAIAFGLLSLLWGAVLTVLSLVEEWTNGWGVGGRMFSAVYFGDGSGAWYQQLFLFTTIFLFFLFFGSGIATVYVRWKANGVLAFFAVLALVLVGLVALVTFTENWPAVGEWFVASGPYGVASWALLPAALSALAGYFILRRATPKN